jgi:hypothetical protein
MATITRAIREIIALADRSGVLDDGLEIATYTDDADDTGLPLLLSDPAGTLVSDDRELDEMRAALRAHGWRGEADDTGVSIYSRHDHA